MFSKKSLFIAALATSVFAASCLKNDANTSITTPPTPQNPELEISAIDHFTDSMGFSAMVYDPNLSGFKYEVLAMGDTTNGKIGVNSPIGIIKYKGTLLNGKGFDSSYTRSLDSTVSINFSQTSVIGAWGYVLFPGNLPVKIGRGGHIRFVTPSKYAYGALGSGNLIPPNTPLFFDIYLKDVRNY